MNMPLIQNEPPDPNLEETRAFWRETGRELVRNSIQAIDETARQIITVAGILEGLYFHAISFSDIRGAVSGGRLWVYLLPLVIILVSLVAAFGVFFPERFRINLLSSTGSQAAYETILHSKLLAMRIAAISLVLGVGSIILAMGVYLGG